MIGSQRPTTHLSSFGVPPEKVEGQRAAQVELQGFQDDDLHAANLGLAVGAVGDVHEVVDLRRVHLLVFARDQHRRDAHQLQLVPLHRLLL